MTNLHRSPPVNQSKTDLGIVNESQLPRLGISPFGLKLRRQLNQPNRSYSQICRNPKRLFEREEIRQRVADFKATQLKFEREREEYFKRMLAKVRSGSLTIPKRLPALKVENRNQQGRSPWEQ